MVEQPAVNRRVRGSSPLSGAIFLTNQLMYWVYILQNAGGRFYVGHTEDVVSRLRSHNDTNGISGKFTRKNGPWEQVWSEGHPTRSSAAKRERQIKSMKSARWIREHLLNPRVPTGRD
jgi:putative endonuclease